MMNNLIRILGVLIFSVAVNSVVCAQDIKEPSRFAWADKEGNMRVTEKYFYPDGQLREELNYVNETLQGNCRSFFKNGKVSTEWVAIDGKREGWVRSFYENGDIREKVLYENDEPNGPYTVYYEGGALKERGVYKNGLRNGVVSFYHDTGIEQMSVAYEMGNPSGRCLEYHPNGQLKQEFLYVDGDIEGEVKVYSEDGVLLRASEYRNGKETGLVKEYFSNERVKSEYYLQNNIKEGEFKDYYQSGVLKRKGVYKRGKFEGIVESYSDKGELISAVTYSAGEKNGFSKEYFVSGQLKSEMLYKDGRLNGFARVFFENGQVSEEGEYQVDVKVGLWRYYSNNGLLIRSSNYSFGKLDGEQREFSEKDGRLYVTRYYTAGEENRLPDYEGEIELYKAKRRNVSLCPVRGWRNRKSERADLFFFSGPEDLSERELISGGYDTLEFEWMNRKGTVFLESNHDLLNKQLVMSNPEAHVSVLMQTDIVSAYMMKFSDFIRLYAEYIHKGDYISVHMDLREIPADEEERLNYMKRRLKEFEKFVFSLRINSVDEVNALGRHIPKWILWLPIVGIVVVGLAVFMKVIG